MKMKVYKSDDEKDGLAVVNRGPVKPSKAYMFLSQCVGWEFHSRKSGRQLDQWEVFAMGFRSMEQILGVKECRVLATRRMNLD